MRIICEVLARVFSSHIAMAEEDGDRADVAALLALRLVLRKELVLLPRKQDPFPVPGEVHRRWADFAAAEGRNGRSPPPHFRRHLHQRHARPHPMAGPKYGRSTFSTGRHQSRRINARGHRRLALLGLAGLPLLKISLRNNFKQPCRKDTKILNGRTLK
jgi:hypothetical protein